MDQKQAFAQRLRDAMQAAGIDLRPAALLNLFNNHYWGRSVSFQTVSRWMRGQAIPSQDKLITLASILYIEPEVLRFGNEIKVAVKQHQARWSKTSGYLERETFDAFMQLKATQRKLIREMILMLARCNQHELDQAALNPPQRKAAPRQ